MGEDDIQIISTRLQYLIDEVREIKVFISRVHEIDRRLALVEQFCDREVKPALNRVDDNRMEIAKVAAGGAGVATVGGTVAAIIIAIGKTAGWW
jgi:hypothetical protein